MQRVLRCLLLLALISVFVEPAQAQRARRGAAAAAAAFGAARGEMLAQACFTCHGTRGASLASAVPSIGGQGAIYLASTMMAYKEDRRPASVMGRIARGYSDQEISEMSQYIAKQPFQRAVQATDPGKVARGARVYRKVCAECHLDGGREASEVDYPILAGQRLMYMQMQMHEIYTSGKRKIDGKFLGSLAHLSRDEIEAVLHFFAAQR